MKKIMLAAMILFSNIASAAGPVGSLSTINTLTIGGYIINAADPTYVALATYVENAGLTYGTFRTPAGTPYQVPAGKTLTIWAMKFLGTQSNTTISMCYGASDVGFKSATPPSSIVYEFGDVLGSRAPGNQAPSYTLVEYGGLNFQVPAGNFPCINGNGYIAHIWIFGYVN